MPARMNAQGLHCKLSLKKSCWFRIVFLIHLKSGAAIPPPAAVGWKACACVCNCQRVIIRHALTLFLPGSHYISHTALHLCMEIALLSTLIL